jgi:hypothetical protein
MRRRRQSLRLCILLASAAALQLSQASIQAQEPSAVEEGPAAGDDLTSLEARLAERYDRLELLVARLAELSGSTQPRRAALLRQLVAKSRDRDVAGQFDRVIEALEQQSYSTAIDGQSALETELQRLLELLLQEDRDRQIESERKRVARFLQDVNKLIRLQRGVSGRTSGGDNAKELAEDQGRIGDQTEKLGDEVAQSEETAEQKARREQAQGSEGDEQGDASKPGKGDAGQGKPQEGADKSDKKEGESDEQPKGEDGKSPEEQDASADENESESSPGQSGEKSDSQSQPSQGKPGQPQQSQGQPGEGSPSDGQPQDQQGEQSQQDEGTPTQRAAERLKQAQQRMQQAQQQLEQAKRAGALKQQEKAVEELEQAKAELERILRQLREEELERMLVMLEARFRKMLEEQIEIYDETQRLDAATGKAAEHELEIASGRLSRKESLLVREADRALVLLREDGTSIAFPEAIEQARDDMQSIANRLRNTKVDLITQGLEEDVIAALEEALAAMQQALKELREQKDQQQQQGGGAPGEKRLVEQLAELRMIRSLQARVNNRTRQYGAMIGGEQAWEEELLEALRELSRRQQKIFQATKELSIVEQQE